jgi:hypothetical protein
LQAVIIKDHKSFLKVHPNTFRGQAAIEWLRGHAARALFGSEAEKEKNQQLSRSVALLLGQKLLAVGVFRQVTGSLTKPLEDPNGTLLLILLLCVVKLRCVLTLL